MSNKVITVEGISKMYELGMIGSGTMYHTLWGYLNKIRGVKNDIEISEKEFWALKDINFEVNEGEVIGIIGRNGAGKSTLLKVLSRITEPTSGRITVKGRVASLLEVGTGFHPELSGRENIFLNGSILGMKRTEIKRKFDEIVDFSGVEKFLDTPVKRYSSGMYVRLAFAVAAHLEPEVLVIDEVLSVGDAAFQKKSLGKMNDIAKSGRTVLFVSHNMGAVENLCSRGVLLSQGSIQYTGEVKDCIYQYLSSDATTSGYIAFTEKNVSHQGPRSFANIKSIELFGEDKIRIADFPFGKKMIIKLLIDFKRKSKNVEIGIRFTSMLGVNIGGFVSTWEGFEETFEEGEQFITIELPYIYMMPGKYFITTWAKYKGGGIDHQISNCISFLIYESENHKGVHLGDYKNLGVSLPSKWMMTNV